MMYNMNMTKNKILSFIIFATVTFSASFIGSISTYAHKEPWYSTLIKFIFPNLPFSIRDFASLNIG